MKWGRNAILKREVQSNFCSVVVMYFSFLNCQGPKDEKIWITKSCYLKAGMHIRFHISFSYSRLFERCYSSTLAFGRTPFPCAYWKPLYEEEWRTPSIHRCYSNNNKSSPKNRQWQMASNFFFSPTAARSQMEPMKSKWQTMKLFSSELHWSEKLATISWQ